MVKNIKKREEMSKNWKLHHIAIVVRDIDKAVEYYKSIGIAVDGREVEFPEKPPRERAHFVQVGPTPIEFIQPLRKDSMFQRFLDTKGEGLNHIAFAVEDLDAELKELKDKGVNIIIHAPAPAAFGAMAAHMDTRRVADVAIQLIQEE
jgi:methylmalonyl-CoA/ethylmalonyl-CoA epimerase